MRFENQHSARPTERGPTLLAGWNEFTRRHYAQCAPYRNIIDPCT